ncbi:MAG TPA: hypothetical protein VFV90_03550 [Usitatibacter sp.]|nr:hypothetical protein [Usitatibacter sp.]
MGLQALAHAAAIRVELVGVQQERRRLEGFEGHGSDALDALQHTAGIVRETAARDLAPDGG